MLPPKNPALAEWRSERCLRRPRAALLARAGELRDQYKGAEGGPIPGAIWADLMAWG